MALHVGLSIESVRHPCEWQDNQPWKTRERLDLEINKWLWHDWPCSTRTDALVTFLHFCSFTRLGPLCGERWPFFPFHPPLHLTMSVSTILNSPLPNTSPTRAIASTLTTRSEPSIPPASRTYEPLVKAVLRHRLLYRLFPHALLFSWALVVAWSTWQQGGMSSLGLRGTILNLVSPSTLSFAVAIWIVGIVPLVILRKAHVTGEYYT